MSDKSAFIIKTIGKTLNATSVLAPKFASKKALSLFASPRKGRYTEKQLQVVSDAVFKTYYHNNLLIATYHWENSGKTVLLAHGWESNASRWKNLLERLKKQNYNIIAIDAPAHGKSDGTKFNAVMYSEFLGTVCEVFEPEIIIGHSVGGMSTIFCQYNNQFQFVKNIVLLGAPAHFDGVFTRYKDMMGYNQRIWSGLNDLVLKRFGKPVNYFSSAKFSEDISANALIIHDKFDSVIPYEDALLYQRHYKNSTLITTEGYGHGLKNIEIDNYILEFIK